MGALLFMQHEMIMGTQMCVHWCMIHQGGLSLVPVPGLSLAVGLAVARSPPDSQLPPVVQ
jgi:hypothetical protein